MRFVVDLYRGVILLCIGTGFIAGSYVIASRISSTGAAAGIDGWNWPAAIALVVATVISAGFAATIISIHDRLVEMGRDITRIAVALEAQSAKSNQPQP